MNNKTAIIAVVAVIIIVIAAAAVALSSGGSDNSNQDSNDNDSPSTAVEGYYSYSYSFVDYYQENPFLLPTLPSPGNVFAKVDIRIQNLSSSSLTTSTSNFKFTANGVTNSVDEVVGNDGYFADDIDIGDTVTRTFYYEVPQNASQIELSWVGDENVILNYSI